MKTLIKNATIVTMDDKNVIKNGTIAINNDTIVHVGEGDLPDAETLHGFEKCKVIDAAGKLALPGIVNSHTHIPMSIMRGYADDFSLQTWLFDNIIPVEEKLTEEDIFWASQLSLCEMLLGGTTWINDMYFFVDKIAQAVLQSGIRANLARGLTDLQNRIAGQLRLDNTRELFAKWNGAANGRIAIDVAPHAVYTSSPQYLSRCAELAHDLGAGVHVHVSENVEENRQCFEVNGKSPTKHLHELGFFTGRTVAAHCVYLNDEDIEIFAKNRVSIAHNIGSNLKLASGIAPVQKYLDSGINVCLGTDGAASNNKQDMFSEMHLSALAAKGGFLKATDIPAYTALQMATTNGAYAFGAADVGMIKQGYKADIILIDTNNPSMTPLLNPHSSLVYSANSSHVDTVIIDGNVIVEKRELKTLDFEQIKYNIHKICDRVL